MASYAMLTNLGRNKEAAALANGTALDIAEIAWGDGSRIPAGGETALENEQGRKPVAAKGVTAGALNTAWFDVLLAEDEGPYIIREAAIFDVDGDMIAVAHYDPPVNKPLDTVSAHLRINVVFSDLQNLIIKIDASTAFVPATRLVTAGAGLQGGGDLSEDRSFAADFASQAEALAGASAIKVMSPLTVSQAISQAVDALVAGAPGALDTLKELADALGDNDDAIAALTNQIATKLNSADYTAADVLAKLLTVDGAGSSLDADLLDGLQGAAYAKSARIIAAGTGLTGGGDLSANRSFAIQFSDQGTAEAGTNSNTVMNPLRTKQAIAAYLSDPFPIGCVRTFYRAAYAVMTAELTSTVSGSSLKPFYLRHSSTDEPGLHIGSYSGVTVPGTWEVVYSGLTNHIKINDITLVNGTVFTVMEYKRIA